MHKKAKTLLVQALKVLFSVGLIYWLIGSGKLEFSSLSKLLTLPYLLTGFLCIGMGMAIGIQRWRKFLESQNLPISFVTGIKLTLIGTFFNFAVPGGVGGDLVKGYYIAQASPHAKISAALTILMDRLIGLFSMLVIALMMMLYRWDLVSSTKELLFIFQMLCLIMAAFAVLWAQIFSRRLYELKWVDAIFNRIPKGGALLKTYEYLMLYRHHKNTFFVTFLLSLGAQVFSIFFFVIAGYGLGYSDMPISVYFFVIPIAFMVQSIPVSPAGVGVGQAATYFLFNTIRPGSGPIGAAATTASQIVQFCFGLVGAYFYLGISKKLKNPALQSQPEKA
jgi:uncharacterized protein (TIRG00374 family)